MNFWIKTFCGDKITRNKIVKNTLTHTRENAEEMLREACHELDISTPVITKRFYENIENFNYFKFLKTDFIEETDFDCLVIEQFTDK